MTTEIPVGEETQALTLRQKAREFYNRGLIDQARYEAMLYEINRGIINDDAQLVEDLHEAVTGQFNSGWSSKERKELHAQAEETLDDLGLPDLGKSWEGGETMSTKIINGPGRFLASVVQGILPGADLPGTSKVEAEEMEADEFRDFKTGFARQLLSDKVITNDQYNEMVREGMFQPDTSLADVMDMLGDELGVSDQVIEDALNSSSTATLRRRNREMQAREEAAEVAAGTEELITSEEKTSNLAAFEKLNETWPGRYVFDPARGRIYEVGTGQLVDSRGEVVEADAEGNYPEGITVEDSFWTEAQMQSTPWDEYGIEMDSYYGLLDVVENPQRYHEGGIDRFASGDPFIGGFSADYGVAQSAELQRQIGEERKGPEQGRSALRRGMGEYAYETWTQDIQDVRRPWYDQGDNWALYAGRSPEAIAEEQQKLIDMGALEAGDVVQGVWGPAEADVLTKMMTVANGQAVKIEDLDGNFWSEFWKDQTSGGAATRRAFVAPTYSKLDPATAQLTIEDTVRRMLGRDATDDELADLGMHMSDMHRQSFQADVQALRQEYDATTRAIDTETAQSGGEVQGIDWESQFQTKFNERNEAELARFDRTQDRQQRQQLIGGALNGFMNQLGGGIGGGSMGGR